MELYDMLIFLGILGAVLVVFMIIAAAIIVLRNNRREEDQLADEAHHTCVEAYDLPALPRDCGVRMKLRLRNESPTGRSGHTGWIVVTREAVTGTPTPRRRAPRRPRTP